MYTYGTLSVISVPRTMNTTHFIGIKELRQHMARVTNRAVRNKELVIVLRKNKPLFALEPLSEADSIAELFRKDIEEARSDKKAGRTYSQADVEKILGL